MITNGHSELALERGAFATPPPSQRCNAANGCGEGLKGADLTYKAQGGTGLFSFGLLDTHFSERDRETRLAVFTSEVNQTYAFGVDETTALLVDQQSDQNSIGFSVVGAQGVFIVDRSTAHSSEYVNIEPGVAFQKKVSGFAHYLNDGSNAVLELKTRQWSFELAGEERKTRRKLKALSLGEWRDRVRWQCGDDQVIAWTQFNNQYQLKASNQSVFFINKNSGHCSYANLPYVAAYTLSE